MKILFLALLVVVGTVSFAKEERYTSRVNGIDYTGDPLTIEDDKFYEVLAGSSYFMVDDVNCFLKLGLEEGITGMYQSGFEIQVTFNVYGYTSPTTSVNLGSVPLTIDYDPLATSAPNVYLASKRINGYHKIEVSITSIIDVSTSMSTTLPKNSYMELELVVDRFYEPDEEAVFATDFDLNHEVLTSTNELSFYWDYIRGAEYYELEWVHVNNYEADGDTKDDFDVPFTTQEFRFNSTRIRTSAEHYEIPLIFDKGFIVYRLRPVGIWDNNDVDTEPNNEVFGKWTTYLATDNRDHVDDFAPHVYEVTAEHEAEINWQYQAVYAEEGKKKDVVTYYDGTLRSRQTATKMSSNDKVVVGETIYDSEGRPAVTILPVPTVTGPVETADVLGYHPEFNQNTDDVSYSLYDFDLDVSVDACGVSLPGSLNAEGAGLYYGSGVDATGNWQDQVPDAEGYPFVQVEYMPDNTGRIKRQSGVGADYTIESDHATRYFYTQPYQEELDRLFGANAGYKSRYKKNVVIDANGQVSVSYIDPFGRVIATALVGAEPSNLIPLADGGGTPLSDPANTLVVDLLAKTLPTDPDTPNDQNHLFSTGNFGNTLDGLKFSTEQIVYQNNSDLKYKYTLEAGRFEVTCGATTLDYPYVFDLSIGLEDACGANVYETPVENLTIGSVSDLGNQSYSNDAIASSGGIWGDDLDIGTYSNYKILKVNEAAAHFLAQQYIEDGQEEGCIKTLEDFQTLFQGQLDFSGCGMDCATCLESLGEDSTTYLNERKEDYDWLALSTEAKDSLLVQFANEYIVLTEECEELCGTGVSYCETIREQMLMDVSLHGQYGAVSGDMSMSVFNPDHILPGAAASIDWQHPASFYMNSDGTLGKVDVVNIGGVWTPEFTGDYHIDPGTGTPFVYPQQLVNLTDFMIAWDPNWAESLLAAHPESCYLDWCSSADEFSYTGSAINGNFYTTEDFDNLILSIGTYAEAANVAELGSVDLTNLTVLMGLDPFFDNITNTVSAYIPAWAPGAFTNYYSFPGPQTIDIWEFAIFGVNNGDDFGVIPAGTPPGNYTVNATNEDEIWNNFKMLYIGLKQQFYEIWAHEYAVTAGCYNGCIGNSNYDVNAFGFASANSTVGPFFGTSGFDGNLVDEELPCSFQNAENFAGKTPRFFGVNEALSEEFGDTPAEMVENINLGIYNETGLCPLAFDLMTLLNGLAAGDDLTTSVTPLNGQPYFGVQLYAGFGGNINADFSFGTSMLEDLDYIPTTSGANDETLVMAVENSVPDNECQSIELTLEQYGGVTPGNLSWLDYGSGNDWVISSFHSFYFEGQTSPGVYEFSVIAVVEDLVTPANGPYEVLVHGTTCLMVGQCVADGESGSPATGTIGALQIPCEPLTEAYGMMQMFNYMLTDSSAGIKYFFKDQYIPASDVSPLLAGNPFLDWNTSGNHHWDMTSVGTQRTIKIMEWPSQDKYIIVIDNVPANVQSFVEIVTYEAPDFKVKMLLDDGTFVYSDATIHWQPQGWDPQPLGLGTCGNCVGEEQQTTDAVNIFIENLLEDEDAADIPLLVLEALGLEQYAGVITVVGPVVNGTHLSYGFDIDADTDDDNVGTFIIYPTDGTTNLQSLTIAGYTPLHLQGSSGPFYGRKEILKSDDEYVEIEIVSPIAIADCPCVGQIDAPMTCADAYTQYLAELPVGINAIGSQEEFCALNYQDYLQTFLTLMNNSVNSGYPLTSINEHYMAPSGFVGNTGIDPFTVYVYMMENSYDAGFDYDYYVSIATVAGIEPLLSHEEFEEVASSYNCFRYYQNYLGSESPTMNIDEFCGTLPSSCQENPTIDMSAWDDYTWEYENDCEEQLINSANLNAIEAYHTYIEMVEQEFITNYINSALENVVETFELEAPDNEYHYTLYYYDQAGNLVSTVPPAGVNRINNSVTLNAIKAYRASNSDAMGCLDNPEHRMWTNYAYNALNQLVMQHTPDGGVSRFWYDALGRLVVSQNSEQFDANRFSYTVYDELGRIVEVGELLADDALLTGGLPAAPDFYFNSPLFPGNFAENLGMDRYQVTKTYYDEPLISLGGDELNGRNRIGSVTYQDLYTMDENEYQSAYHYRYDIHGNVSKMVQEIRREPSVAESGLTSTVEYTYDLVSGNVLEVAYNSGRVDQFYHRYEYDADNRITRTYTSQDGVNFLSDAKYFYYDHGPLARTEIGNDKVQGSDFAYTVQGWLKSANGVKIDAENIDMGHDSYTSTSNLNNFTAGDAFGFALTYYTGDYISRTTGGDDFMGDLSSVATLNDLFNGNIAQMATALTDDMYNPLDLIASNYEYDQLNRIKHMEANRTDVASYYDYANAATGSYESEYTYDHNGNILYLSRKSKTGSVIDNFTYYYTQTTSGTASGAGAFDNPFMTNRLNYVDDGAGAATMGDIGNTQMTNNYLYNNIGQLIQDEDEEIDNIEWTVTGKVKKIERSSGSTKDELEFIYDPMGNRIAKIVKPRTGGNLTDEEKWEYTYYTFDAGGNVMAIYGKTNELADDELTETYTLMEQNIYGSSRVGLLQRNEPVAVRVSTAVDDGGFYDADGYFIDITSSSLNMDYEANPSDINFEVLVGARRYELSNHLGNVLEVVSDRKVNPGEAVGHLCFVRASNQYAQSTSFNAGLGNEMTIEAWVKTTDTGISAIASYANFLLPTYKGMNVLLDNGKVFVIGRNGTSTSYTINGTIAVNDGQWHHIVATSEDGVWKAYVDGVQDGQNNGPSGGFSGLTTTFLVGSAGSARMDGCIKEVSFWNYAKDGVEILSDYDSYDGYTGAESGLITYWKIDEGTGTSLDNLTSGSNNLTTVNSPTWDSEDMIAAYEPEVIQWSDYYPFGWQMPERSGGTDDYRYTFQGMEEDDEVKNDGNSFTTHFRMLDPRIGRWLSVDPITHSWESPYVSMGNNPIGFTDISGSTLDIPKADGTEQGNKNVEASKSDLLGLVNENNKQYIKFENGSVQLDFGELGETEVNEILKNDEGLSLLNDLISSDKKFLYEASDIGLIRDEFGDKIGAALYMDGSQILNISNNGKDSDDALTNLPNENYDGQVIIHPDAKWEEEDSEGNTIIKSRSSIVFHELAENYERTHNGVDYKGEDGAHERAIEREEKWSGKSNMPGRVTKVIPAAAPTSERFNEILEIFNKYYGL